MIIEKIKKNLTAFPRPVKFVLCSNQHFTIYLLGFAQGMACTGFNIAGTCTLFLLEGVLTTTTSFPTSKTEKLLQKLDSLDIQDQAMPTIYAHEFSLCLVMVERD